MSIKTAFECPNQIFTEVQRLTDYDYCLVNLFKENQQYRENFLQASRDGREIILDNSVFELDKAWDTDEYVEVARELNPTWLIVPDVLENQIETILNYITFKDRYKDLPFKLIGVLQGKNYTELSECYRWLTHLGVDKIGISFDYSFYEKIHPSENKLVSWCSGRKKLIDRLMQEEFWDSSIPVHLLGCSLMLEFNSYSNQEKYEFIDSLDTSNPIVSALKGFRYDGEHGLQHKPSEKLFTLIDTEVSEQQFEDILYNIDQFKNSLY